MKRAAKKAAQRRNPTARIALGPDSTGKYMRIIDCQQGSPEWIQARLGIPTASNFDQIVTPLGNLSKSSAKYMHKLLAERLLGQPADAADNQWMQRGKELEPDAVRWYEFDRNVDTTPVGFVTNDLGTYGASPDRLVGADGLLEVKCPSVAEHVGNLLDMVIGYTVQVQGQLWVCERQWCDLLSFNPRLPNACVRIERDEEFIEKLAHGVNEFVVALEVRWQELLDKGCKPHRSPYGARCRAQRDDGRWCMASDDLTQVDGEWYCPVHVPTVELV